ncbi:UNVERIFIED_CONTAM: Abscisic acid 8'-hydroxylase 3 [Sesamum calycinum]|uniref:Abscisic acid 8'-hydroxylase 3 n=1 Tax=Sesamum calycinum TaxID=2727403 RepID=A0AAW2JUG9_9LAMI
MEMATGFWVGILAVVGWLLWWWNDILYALRSLRRTGGGAKLPPGYMGIPFLGEMLTFLCPNEVVFIEGDEHFTLLLLMIRIKLFLGVAFCGTCTTRVAVQGSSHTRVRSFVMRAINQPDALHKIALRVQPRITVALESWAQKGRIRVYKEARRFILLLLPVPEMLNFLPKAEGQGALWVGPTQDRLRLCRKKAIAIFRDEMEKRKKCDTSKGKNDLMEGLMQMKDDDGEQLTETEVLDNIVSLVVAGYTSTSVAIMWAFYYLAMHPNVVEKLREEHMSMTKKLNGEFITYDDISSCEYTGKVVEEIIRLANIAAFIFQTAKTDVEYKGYIIPKGWKVVCWLRYLHTNPENFEDPMCFNPDKWNEPPKPGSYLVFGGGSRICAGNMLVRLQVAVLLHHLVVGYRWELVNPNAKMSYLLLPKPADEVEILSVEINPCELRF